MFGKSMTLFKLFGFEVKIDISWIFIAVLITWSLAKGFFPGYYNNLEPETYWWMGIAGAIGLFISIIIHELFHSLVARRFGIQMRGITLFIFGGVAEMDEEPDSPKTEFFMAIVGPIVSIIIAFIFYGLYYWGNNNGWPRAQIGVLDYLWWINLILAGFNLLPAFPLDGGRVFRSALWQYKGNIQWATRIATNVGRGFGFFLIIIGIYFILKGSFINGLWWALTGLFLRNASQMSLHRTLIRKALEGESAGKFMKKNPVTVSSSITINNLVQNYIYKYHYKMFPVVDGKKLIGCISTTQVKEIPKAKWSRYKVSEGIKHCSPENSVSPDTDAMKVFSIMSKTKNSRLMVLSKDKIVGVITLKDMLEFLALKLDLEGEDLQMPGINKNDLE
ncbi:MAG: site-2 protease family protein [Spirochaetota bacterium]